MKNAFANSGCLLVLLAAGLVVAGCKTPSSSVADAGASTPETAPDVAGGGAEDSAVEASKSDAPTEARAANDARMPDLLPDLPPGADRSPADAGTDGAADGPAGATSDGAEAGCSGWTSLVHLQPKDLADLLATTDPIVINVHTPYAGDIPGTDTSIPYNKVDDIEAYLKQDHCADVVLVCESGTMSQLAGDDLIKRGYLRVRDLAGGMSAWVAAGYPLLKDGGT